MHEVNRDVLRATFPAGSHLVELGCGTGTEALALAKQGCRVFALDISPNMIERARAKARAAGLADRATFVVGRTADVAELVRPSTPSSYDGAYANFSLTFEEDLRSLGASLAAILRPGAFFVCTLPNRLVLSEVLVYGALLRFRHVLWRFATPLRKEVHGVMLEIHAYSPWQIREAFDPWFELRRTMGVPVFVPPVYLHPQYRRLGDARRVLEGLDARLAGRFPWNRLGEHTLFVFRRK